MNEPAISAVIDSNVWVSAALNPAGPPAAVARAFRDGRFVSVSCDRLLKEVNDVLARPRIRDRIPLTAAEIQELLELIEHQSVMAVPPGRLVISRDPNDDFVVETAIAGAATYLVSRDDDIKRDPNLIARLREYGIEVVSVAQFLAVLASS